MTQPTNRVVHTRCKVCGRWFTATRTYRAHLDFYCPAKEHRSQKSTIVCTSCDIKAARKPSR